MNIARMLSAACFGALLMLGAVNSTMAQKAAPVEPAKEEVDSQKSAQRADAENLLKSLKDQARVAFATTDKAPTKLTGDGESGGCSVKPETLKTAHYKVHDAHFARTKENHYSLIAEAIDGKSGVALLTYNNDGGTAEIVWYDSIDALTKANEDIKLGKTVAKDDTETKKEAADGDLDAYALYKKKGRKWMHKSTTTIEGMAPMISYMSYEITEVTEEYAMQKLTMLDKDKKQMAYMDPIEQKIEFVKAAPVKDNPKNPVVEMKEETIKVEAGEFLCYAVEVSGTKSWTSKKFPGLLVKMETEYNAMELVEWTE